MAHRLVQLSGARVEHAGQVEERTGHLARGVGRSEHHPVPELEAETLDQPATEDERIGALLIEERSFGQVVREPAPGIF